MVFVDQGMLGSINGALTKLMEPDPSVYGPQPSAPSTGTDNYSLSFDQPMPMPQASPDMSPWQPATYVPPAPIEPSTPAPMPSPVAPPAWTPDSTLPAYQPVDTSMWDNAAPGLDPFGTGETWSPGGSQWNPLTPADYPQGDTYHLSLANPMPEPTADPWNSGAYDPSAGPAIQSIAPDNTYRLNPNVALSPSGQWGEVPVPNNDYGVDPSFAWDKAASDARFNGGWSAIYPDIAQGLAEGSPSALLSKAIAPATDRLPGGDVVNGLVSGVAPWLIPGVGPLDAALRAPEAYQQGGAIGLGTELGGAAINAFGVPGAGKLAGGLTGVLGETGAKVAANSLANGASIGALTALGDYANTGKVDWGNALEQAAIGAAIPAVTEGAIPALKATGRALAPEGAIGRGATRFNTALENLGIMPGLGLKDVSGETPDLGAAKKAYTDYIAGEANIRRTGTTAREISQGRSEQASGILSGIREGIGTGANADEMLARTSAGAATGPLAKTFTDVAKPTAEHQAALTNEIARMADAGEISPFDALRGMKALDKVTKGEKLQPAELKFIAKTFGDEAAKAIADRVETPEQSAARAAKEDAKLRRETAQYNNSAVVRQEKAAVAQEQALNRELASKQETVDRASFRAKWKDITKAGNAVDDAQLADLNNALRTTPEEAKIARNAITDQAERAQSAAGQAAEKVAKQELPAKISKFIESKVPEDQQPIVRNTVTHWVDQNDVRLRALGTDGPNVIDRISASVSGNVADSFLSGLLRRQTELQNMLTMQGVDPEIAKGMSKLLFKQELKLRADAMPPMGRAKWLADAAAMLEPTKPLGYGEGTFVKGMAALSQGVKELQFGLLDVGVFGQQLLKALTTSGPNMLAGLTNRLLTVSHLPHVDTDYLERGYLPKQVKYASDGLLMNFLSGVTERELGHTVLSRIPGVGKYVDPQVVRWTNFLNDIQFKHVLGAARTLTYEGNLVLAHVAGQDIQDPRVRATAAAHANAATSAAYKATKTGRALAESAALMSPSMRRAQVAQIAQVAKVFSVNATAAERLLGATTILSTVGSTVLIGKLLNDAIGTSPFQFDPSKPGFGQIRLPSGLTIDMFPQEQVVKAIGQSLRYLQSGDPVAAATAWGKLGISSSSPALQIGEHAAGVGFDPNKGGYTFGGYGNGMDLKGRLLNMAPLPPVLASIVQGDRDPASLGLNFAGVNSYQESPLSAVFHYGGENFFKLSKASQDAMAAANPDLQRAVDALAKQNAGESAAGADKLANDRGVVSAIYDKRDIALNGDPANPGDVGLNGKLTEADVELQTARRRFENGTILDKTRADYPTDADYQQAQLAAYQAAVDKWKNDTYDAKSKIAAVNDFTFKDLLQKGDLPQDPTDPVNRYYAAKQSLTDPSTGKIDFDKLDQWLASQDELTRGAIQGFLGSKGTPEQDQQYKDQQAIQDSGYYDSDNKGQFLRDHPDVAKLVETWNPGSPVLVSNILTDQFAKYQGQDDAKLQAGAMTPAQWKDSYSARQDQMRAEKDQLYAGLPAKEQTALDSYYAEMDRNKDANGGNLNFDELQQWVAKQPQEVRDAIDGKQPGKALTPVVAQFVADRQKIEDSHYWDIQDRVFQKFADAGAVPLYQPGQTEAQWTAATRQEIYQRVIAKGLDPNSAQLITQDVMDKLTKSWSDVDTKVTTAFRTAEPAVTALLVRWGYYDPSAKNELAVINQFRNNPDLAVAAGQ